MDFDQNETRGKKCKQIIQIDVQSMSHVPYRQPYRAVVLPSLKSK